MADRDAIDGSGDGDPYDLAAKYWENRPIPRLNTADVVDEEPKPEMTIAEYFRKKGGGRGSKLFS